MKTFTKMHGLGNTFVLAKGPADFSSTEIAAICTGESVDGFLVVTPRNENTIKMNYWNADGSEAEMCGNGLRCVARFSVDNNLIKKEEFVVETDAGSLKVSWDGHDYNKIDTQIGKVTMRENPIRLQKYNFYIANIGNPHAITFVKNVKKCGITTIGPVVENDKHFPHKTNVEFVQVVSKNKMKVRIWERGVGETSACGTGMSAAAFVALKTKGMTFPIDIEVPGGCAEAYIDDEAFAHIIASAKYLT